MKDDLSTTLLLIPCTAGKRGDGVLDLPQRQLVDTLSSGARELLLEGRRLSWERPKTHIDTSSELRAAAEYYSGHPYKDPGFLALLAERRRQGMHCLILSGGYGLVLPEEPIHRYEAHLPSHTRGIWRPRLARILADYVDRNGISQVFGSFSKGYAAVLPERLAPKDVRIVPTFVSGVVDDGSALQVVPHRIGQAVMGFLGNPVEVLSSATQ